jgi:hypothetical protein
VKRVLDERSSGHAVRVEQRAGDVGIERRLLGGGERRTVAFVEPAQESPAGRG